MFSDLAREVGRQPQGFPQRRLGTGVSSGEVRSHMVLFVRENWLPPLTGKVRPYCHFVSGAEFVDVGTEDMTESFGYEPLCSHCRDVDISLVLAGIYPSR